MHKYKTNIFCLNCGKEGHLQSRCLYPINSWGIICIAYKTRLIDLFKNSYCQTNVTIDNITTDNNELLTSLQHNLKFLLIRRKNSLCFVEFIRGRYYFDNLQYIYNMISKMSVGEQESLCQYEFDILWCNMWNIKNVNKNHLTEYNISKTKFNKLKDGVECSFNKTISIFITIEIIISRNKSIYNEPEWELPKGRKNSKETELDCSMREFFEETNIQTDKYTLLVDKTQFIEKYVGSDGVTYKNNYFLSELNNHDTPIQLDNTTCQLSEVSGIKLVSYNDAIDLIRDYSIDKKMVLYNVLNTVYNVIISQ